MPGGAASFRDIHVAPSSDSRPRKRASNEKLLRDPVHGIISLNRSLRRERVLLELLDAPEMQRLRRIRQLGLAYMVYHGAEHSRFTHALGVMHLMGVVMRQISKGYRLDPEEILVGRAAALLHDVGHGPFSHVFERFTEKHHEEWTRDIILSPQSQVHQILSSYSLDLPARVVGVLHDRKFRPRVVTDLISSQLDVDRFDYLLRDSHMTGVKHGIFDLDRLIRTLQVNPHNERLVVSAKGLYPLEKYLHARYYMYRQVYQHRTVVAAEAMLTALMRRVSELLREAGPQGLPPALAGLTLPPLVVRLLRGGVEFGLDEYLQLDETAMYYAIGELRRSGDEIAANLARRLLARDLFKVVVLDDFASLPRKARPSLADTRAILRRHGLAPEYYLLEINSSGVGYAPYDPQSRYQKHIDVEMPDGTYRDVAEVSEIIRALTTLRYESVQYCFPAVTPDGKDIRREVETSLRRAFEQVKVEAPAVSSSSATPAQVAAQAALARFEG